MPFGLETLVIEGRMNPLGGGECDGAPEGIVWVENAVHDGSLEEAILTAT